MFSTEIDYDVLNRPRWSTNTGGFAADSMNYGFRYTTYPKTLNVTARNGEFVVWRNRNAIDSVWMDLTGWVDSVVTRVVDGRSGGLNTALAQKRFVRRYAKNALNQPTSTTADLRQVSGGTVLMALTARGYQYDAARVLTDLTLGTATITIGRTGERLPELWTYPYFQRATAYSARHEDANSYYNVSGLQAQYGRSYAFESGAGRMTQLSRPWGVDTLLSRRLTYTWRGQLQGAADSLLTAPTCTSTGGTPLDGVVCTGNASAYQALAFQYDSAGNLTKQLDQLGGSDSLSATYAAGNRLQTIGGASYTYDLDGNVATRTTGGITTSFTYDHQSQLISVRVGADTTFYGYNAVGRLVTRARNNNSGTTKRTLERVFFWDADHLLAETDSTLVTRVAEYAYAPGVDRPLALLTPGAGGTTKIRYYHQDEVGNVIGLTDTSAVVQALEYTPWGELAPSTLGTVGDTSRVRWKGLLWEDGKTQLYYVRNRWYDAVARRFISEDPIGIDGGLNQYAFAGNDPVNRGDPTGLSPDYAECVATYIEAVPEDAYNGDPEGARESAAKACSHWFAVWESWDGSRRGSYRSYYEPGLESGGAGPFEFLGGVGFIGSLARREGAAIAFQTIGRGRRVWNRTRGWMTDLPFEPGTAKSIFRRFSQGQSVTDLWNPSPKVRLLRNAENGVKMRYMKNGDIRVDLPARGPGGYPETIHFNR